MPSHDEFVTRDTGARTSAGWLLKLLSNGSAGLAFLNAAGQLAAGLIAVFAGMILVRAFGG